MRQKKWVANKKYQSNSASDKKVQNKYLKADKSLIDDEENKEKSEESSVPPKYLCCFTKCVSKSEESSVHQEGLHINKLQRESTINTNFDVKLSGLSSGISADEIKALKDKEEESNDCCISILSMKKRNSIHVALGSMFGTPKNEKVRMHKYSQKDNDDDDAIHEDEEHGDMIFGPGHIQSMNQEDTTDTDRDVYVSDPNIIDSDFEHQYIG